MSTDASGIASAQVGQWNVESNSTTSAALKEALSEHPEAKKGSDGQPKPEEAKPDTSKAASELGKLGGEASAKAKAKAAREAKKAEKESEPESAEPGRGWIWPGSRARRRTRTSMRKPRRMLSWCRPGSSITCRTAPPRAIRGTTSPSATATACCTGSRPTTAT